MAVTNGSSHTSARPEPYGVKTQHPPAAKEVHILRITAGLSCDSEGYWAAMGTWHHPGGTLTTGYHPESYH